MIRKVFHLTYRLAKRIVILVVGFTVLLVGIIMIVTPGPGLIVIPLGLAILSIEFAWARHWLKKVRERISTGAAQYQASRIERRREDL